MQLKKEKILSHPGRPPLLFGSSLLAQNSLSQRIGHTDPSRYTRSRSHNSAGDMAFGLLVSPNAMDVNLNERERDYLLTITFHQQALEQRWVTTKLHQQVCPHSEGHCDTYSVRHYTPV